jgi:hypothetical protein
MNPTSWLTLLGRDNYLSTSLASQVHKPPLEATTPFFPNVSHHIESTRLERLRDMAVTHATRFFAQQFRRQSIFRRHERFQWR